MQLASSSDRATDVRTTPPRAIKCDALAAAPQGCRGDPLEDAGAEAKLYPPLQLNSDSLLRVVRA
jgi:hypothetical protein